MASNNRNHRSPRPTAPVRPARGEDTAIEEDFAEEVTASQAQELEAEGHYITAELDGEDIRIVPPGAWRQSWQTALAAGNLVYFVEHVIHPDDLDLYFEIDPTNDEFDAFITEAGRRAGESLGKSRGPGASSRRMRRR